MLVTCLSLDSGAMVLDGPLGEPRRMVPACGATVVLTLLVPSCTRRLGPSVMGIGILLYTRVLVLHEAKHGDGRTILLLVLSSVPTVRNRLTAVLLIVRTLALMLQCSFPIPLEHVVMVLWNGLTLSMPAHAARFLWTDWYVVLMTRGVVAVSGLFMYSETVLGMRLIWLNMLWTLEWGMSSERRESVGTDTALFPNYE